MQWQLQHALGIVIMGPWLAPAKLIVLCMPTVKCTEKAQHAADYLCILKYLIMQIPDYNMISSECFGVWHHQNTAVDQDEQSLLSIEKK